MVKKQAKKQLPKFAEYSLKKYFYKFALILLIVFCAYFQTFFMYFWNDDNAIIFKLQHLNEGVGNLGSGIFGFDSPYRMVIFPLTPIYYFFGVNPLPFFVYGIFFYILASIAVFIFALAILKEQRKAFLVSMVFASGLVGAESLWRVYNSVHTSITIIFTVLFCGFYFYFINLKNTRLKLLFYLMSFFFFTLSIQWGYVRAHGIILIVLAAELLFNFNWKYSLVRLIPFLYLFYTEYINSNNNTQHFNSLLSKIFENYQLNLIFIPIQTLKNVLLPDIFQIPFAVFLILLGIILFKFRSRIILFSLIFIISGFFTYFVIYQDLILNTTHRYLTMSLPGSSLLIVYLLTRFFKTEKGLFIGVGLYTAMNLIIINWLQFNILINRSLPTKNFYKSLKNEIKTLEKNSVIYFDIEDSEKSRRQFEDFFGVGSMPNETAIAIHYNLDRYDLYLPQTFDEFISYIKEKKTGPEKIYSFFYKADKGLINTTEALREGLYKRVLASIANDLENINVVSSSPFSLKIKVLPRIDSQKIKFVSSSLLDNPKYLDYLSSRSAYYQNSTATSSSEWRNQEIKFINDNNLETSWMSHRVHWHYHSHDEIVIDLRSIKAIGAIKLVLGPTDKTPTKYSYHCSLDGNSWHLINTFYHNPRNHGEEKIDKFESQNCLKIKLELFDTPKKDAPVIREIEVIESIFSELDFKKIKAIEENPFKFVTEKNISYLMDYLIVEGLPMNLCLNTDKSSRDQCQILKVLPDVEKEYILYFEPSGTILKSIKIEMPEAVEFNNKQLTLQYLLINEIK